MKSAGNVYDCHFKASYISNTYTMSIFNPFGADTQNQVIPHEVKYTNTTVSHFDEENVDYPSNNQLSTKTDCENERNIDKFQMENITKSLIGEYVDRGYKDYLSNKMGRENKKDSRRVMYVKEKRDQQSQQDLEKLLINNELVSSEDEPKKKKKKKKNSDVKYEQCSICKTLHAPSEPKCVVHTKNKFKKTKYQRSR